MLHGGEAIIDEEEPVSWTLSTCTSTPFSSGRRAFRAVSLRYLASRLFSAFCRSRLARLGTLKFCHNFFLPIHRIRTERVKIEIRVFCLRKDFRLLFFNMVFHEFA